MERHNPTHEKRRERRLSRRELLRLGAGAAVSVPAVLLARHCQLDRLSVLDARDHTTYLAATSIPFDPYAIPLDAELFPLGVQAGAVRASSGIVWAFTNDDAPKRLLVWRDGPEAGAFLMTYDDVVTPKDGYIKELVEGLEPGARHHYALFHEPQGTLAARSEVGTFRAALPPGTAAPVTVGATACTHYDFAPYATVAAIAEHSPDVFCQLGDMSYNDSASTREQFRALWHATLSDPGYRAVLPRTALYATWDDHEVRNDWKPGFSPAILQAGRDAFLETLPVPRREGGGGVRFWDSYRWGSSVELFVLDCRGERQKASTEPNPTGQAPGGTHARMVSDAQLSWLMEGLSVSPCHFKVVLTSVPMTRMGDYWPVMAGRWEGTPVQRDALLDHIVGACLRNVWFLTGDFHFPAIARVEPEGPRRRIREIFVGPGGNEEPRLLGALRRPHELAQALPASQYEHFGSTSIGTVLTFDPEHDSVRVLFLDGATGEALHDVTLTEDGPA